MIFYIPVDKMKTFVRNFMEKHVMRPATHVSITEHFVEMDIYDVNRKYQGHRKLYILEGRSY